MSKVAIVSDSNSGITQLQAEELGITILPMPFFVGDKTLYEDIDLTQKEFYQMLSENANISTSMPLVGNVTDTWDALLKEYDEIVHIPMSSGLSGSCETALMLAQDYEGKVQVVNNQRISVTQRQSVLDAMALAEQGRSAVEIKEILERDKFESSIYIMVDTLYYLKKGGRITPAAAALGTLLKLKPVLQIQGEKLDAFAKARTVKQAKNTPSARAIRLPAWLAPSVPEHIKHTTPNEMTSTGKKARRVKGFFCTSPSRNSQMVAVYCIPTATGAEVRDRARMTLTHSPA